MRRRDVLNFGGITTLGAGRALAVQRVPVIDTHTHFYDPFRPTGVPWPPKTDSLLYRRVLPADFRRAAAGKNVVGTVIVEASRLVEDNQWILDLAARDKFVKGFIGNLDPAGAAFTADLDRFAANRLFRGIRLNENQLRGWLDNPAVMAKLKLIDERRLTLDVIGGKGVLNVAARLAAKLPGLRIVVDHLPFADQAGIAELKPFVSVYAKVSGILRKDAGRVSLDVEFYRASLDQVWETFGGARVVYASNWPVCEKWGTYRQVQTIASEYFSGKGQAAALAYFHTNSRLAYSWIDR